jgi:hypothetical protein
MNLTDAKLKKENMSPNVEFFLLTIKIATSPSVAHFTSCLFAVVLLPTALFFTLCRNVVHLNYFLSTCICVYNHPCALTDNKVQPIGICS